MYEDTYILQLHIQLHIHTLQFRLTIETVTPDTWKKTYTPTNMPESTTDKEINVYRNANRGDKEERYWKLQRKNGRVEERG